MGTSPLQANALRCRSGLRRSPLALGFSCSSEPDVPSRGKQWNFLSFWLPIPRQWLLQSHKAELPVLPRRRQQRDVLPQRIAIQRQWLLPSALRRAEIHPQRRRGGAGITNDSQARPMRLKILARIGLAASGCRQIQRINFASP